MKKRRKEIASFLKTGPDPEARPQLRATGAAGGAGPGGAPQPQLVTDTWEPLWKVCGAREMVFLLLFF